MINKLENIKIEFYCLKSIVSIKIDPVSIKWMINFYSPSSFCVHKRKLNISIPDSDA